MPGGFGAAGLTPTAGGLGFAAIGGGGLLASELEGLELAGESLDTGFVFFQGVAEPLPAAIPGKTETGLAEVLPATWAATGLGVIVEAGRRGGGGGTAGATFEGAGSR